jgi:hypothetical protein
VPHPNSTHRARSPSRTLVDVHGVLPSDDLVNGSDRAPRDQTDVVSKYPLQHLLVELLQRPIEFTQYLSIRYTERLADAGIELSVGSRGDAYDCEHDGDAVRPGLTPAYE